MNVEIFSSKMSSKRIAERTGKQHSHVIRDIRAMVVELEKDEPRMDDSDYEVFTDERGYTSEVKLNERLSMCLAAGYSVKLRMAIIDDWAAMKAEKQNSAQTHTLPQTYKEALIALLDKVEQVEKLEAVNKELAPKGEAFDSLMSSKGLYSNADAAKILGTGLIKLCSSLRVHGYYNSHNIPYQKYVDEGLFEVKTTTKNGFNFSVSLFSPKGLSKISKKLGFVINSDFSPSTTLIDSV